MKSNFRQQSKLQVNIEFFVKIDELNYTNQFVFLSAKDNLNNNQLLQFYKVITYMLVHNIVLLIDI